MKVELHRYRYGPETCKRLGKEGAKVGGEREIICDLILLGLCAADLEFRSASCGSQRKFSRAGSICHVNRLSRYPQMKAHFGCDEVESKESNGSGAC